MKKIYVVGKATSYANWISNSVLVDTIEEADIVLFTGGEDVHPSFYKEAKGGHTYCNMHRDIAEQNMYNRAKDKFKLGICRGNQFLCVMSGGSLIQHVTNHGDYNEQVTDGENTITIPSTHHQMIYPFDINHVQLMWSVNNKSACYLNGDNQEKVLPEGFKEPEVTYFPDTLSLGIQGHPEMCNIKETHEYLNKLLDKVYEEAMNLNQCVC